MTTIELPEVLPHAEWEQTRQDLLAKEKAQMRDRDAISAQRRRLPMIEFEGDHRFEGPDGEVGLLDLFEGRSQLIVYSFYFASGDEGPCTGCSMFTDNLGAPEGLAHLHDRDATFAAVSLAPQDEIGPFKRAMGWKHPWYTDVNRKFSEDADTTEFFRLSVFLRRGDKVFLTYQTTSRGVEALSGGAMADLLPYGRQEEWEDSPDGYPQEGTYEHGPCTTPIPRSLRRPAPRGPRPPPGRLPL